MAVPQPTFGPNGFIIPAEPDVLVAVKGEINAAFGNQLNMADETPQGQIAVSQAAAVGNANDAFLFLSQQMDPAYNVGRYQDGIARIYFIERFPARPTVVTVTCIGAAGVVIPVNAMVLASDGTQYIATDGGTIPASGTIDLQFECVNTGPIACPAGSIQTIYQAVNGWDQVLNAADGVIGRDTETRAEFEDRRRLSVAANAQGSLPSVLGAVLSVANVLDAYVTENVGTTPLLIKGYTLNPNSIYVAAVGGADADVAKAMWSKKSPGCGYNGNTLVTVEDTNSAYNPPYPSYDVRFERPAAVTVTFLVSLASNQSVPADATTQIQNAIVAAFAGADGGPRARIGDTLFASRFYAPVALLGSWAQIITIKLGCSNAPVASFTGSIAASTLTVTAVASGLVAVGQYLVGPGIVPGTQIIAGAYPTFTLSTVQTVASEAMVSVTSTQDEIQIDIDQQPVTAAGNIAVVLT
jgi:hypothetical protein